MDLWKLDATAQAELVRRKEVKAAELVESSISRIEQLNPTLNAVITPMFEQARHAALQPGLGPFFGVPFLLKDLVAEYEGVSLHEGSAFLQGYVSPVDSEVVRRWKSAGLIMLGKTNTPELGMVPATEPILFGPTCNPWDTGLSPGGSSGGSAVAVACGMVAVAHANDAGGSIRIPASSCGLFGLKPSRGRNPLGPHYGDMASGLIAEHVVTRSVRDSARMLDVTAGPDVGAPYFAPPPALPYAEQLQAKPSRLRVAFSTTAPSGIDVDSDCAEAVHDAARLCVDLGHEVVEGAPSFDAACLERGLRLLYAAFTAWAIDDWSRRTARTKTPESFEPATWRLAEFGWQATSSDYLLAVQDIQRISRDIARFFTQHDVWLTPTMATPPLPPGSFMPSAEDRTRAARNLASYMDFVRIANATGQPAMSVPLYWSERQIPIGVHFLGRYGDESTLFRLAGQLEEARPWAEHWPAIAWQSGATTARESAN